MTAEIALNNVWVLICAALVFIMHAGFACVEAGMTQSKNTANIIMKNFMTIAIGSLCYYIIGYSLMYGNDIGGLIGSPFIGIQSNGYANAEILSLNVFWFFQAVFAATCATIVSGAIAERMKFGVYLGFCLVMCTVIYPVTGHWIWGGGWLSTLSPAFTDFAGSTAVHAVGGFSALIGAKLVGARAGKYPHRGTVKTIPGHSIPLGALGVLLLWFGWFGFNCGSGLTATSDIGLVAVNTILAGAAGAVGALSLSIMKNKNLDVGMTLNGCLAGLVGITAGCNFVDPWAAIVIGMLSGIVMLFAVEMFDGKLKIDDPVGAISVHGITGAFGTICVGIFAVQNGVLTTGSWSLLWVQLLGVAACASFAMLVSFVYFSIVKKVFGLRVKKEEELKGLDITEHGVSAYNTTGTLDI